ncbi:MAG: RIP metalloprotease RseP [Calditrichaeota bacterium]|nr:RIP metalloprotease RseP [Calditrichota bacterium]
MTNILAIIFVFSLLVIIHELGHFLAAKWMGVRVERFSIGFPPKIFSKKIGETEFSISAIPLGGYVKMAGFIDESMDTKVTGAPDEFQSKPTWRKIVIISGGVIMNFLLAILILTLLNFFQGERIIPGTTVGYLGEDGIAQKIGFKQYDKILAINDQPVSTWNDVQERFVDNLNSDIYFKVLRDGKEIVLRYKREWFKEDKGEQLNIGPLIPAKVGEVSPGMPADKIGLKRGDEIIEIAGQPIKDWSSMTEVIRKYPGQEVSIKWKRGDSILAAKITPQVFEEKDTNDKVVKVGKIGISYYFDHQEVGLIKAVGLGVTNTIDLLVINVRSIYWVITGTKSAKEIIGGPIMIAKMAGDAANAGWAYLWYLIAALSTVLAFFNILPIPALDGGHLVFILIEGIKGKPVPIKIKLKVQQIGLAILLTLIIFIFYIDISRMFF